jgi:hypothetical protein
MDSVIHSLLVACFTVVPIQMGQAPSGLVGGARVPARAPAWAKAAELQREVTLAVHGEPLAVACERLSAASGARISCESALAEQRVSLVAAPAQLGLLMLRLADALNHTQTPGRMAEWETGDASGEERYLLRRLPGAEGAFRAELDRPRATALRWLGALREFGATGRTDSPEGADCPVLADLRAEPADSEFSDARLAVQALGNAPLPAIDTLLATGGASVDVPGPPGAEGLPTRRKLRLSLSPGPGVGVYDLTLAVRQGLGGAATEVGYTLDTLGLGQPSAETLQAEAKRDAASGPKIDLFRDAGPGAGTAVTSLATALRLWSRASGRTVVAEVFLKPRASLTCTRGAPDQVLTAICRTFACDWRRIGDVTVVWSRTWAQDREADVGAGQLAALSRDLAGGGKPAVRALAEIGRLPGPKFETAARCLEQAQLQGGRVAGVCRLLGALSAPGLDRALNGDEANLALTDERARVVASLLGHPPAPPVRVSVRLDANGASGVVTLKDSSGRGGAEVRLALRHRSPPE